jgi:3-oxoacyl-[acyl-carrier-protein] synthase III
VVGQFIGIGMNFEIKLSKFANAACSGFVYGVATAEQFIRSGDTD